MFIGAQILGAVAAMFVFRWLLRGENDEYDTLK